MEVGLESRLLYRGQILTLQLEGLHHRREQMGQLVGGEERVGGCPALDLLRQCLREVLQQEDSLPVLGAHVHRASVVGFQDHQQACGVVAATLRVLEG